MKDIKVLEGEYIKMLDEVLTKREEALVKIYTLAKKSKRPLALSKTPIKDMKLAIKLPA